MMTSDFPLPMLELLRGQRNRLLRHNCPHRQEVPKLAAKTSQTRNKLNREQVSM